MNVLRCAVLALFLCSLPVAAQDSDRFANATAGFSLSKPAGWTFNASRTKADLSDEELQKAFAQKPTVPLVAMTNPAHLFTDFQVTLIPRNPVLAGASPRQIVEQVVLPNLKKRSATLTVQSPVRELELSGHAAAEYVATDTIRTGELAMAVRMRAILVSGPRFFYLIDMFTAAADEARSKEDFAKILSSITIDK